MTPARALKGFINCNPAKGFHRHWVHKIQFCVSGYPLGLANFRISNNEILNPQAIEALRSLSPEAGSTILHELIAIYLEDTPKQLVELQEALARQDMVRVIRAAHTIKGSSGNFGAVKLAQEIEAHGKADDLAAAAAALGGVTEHYALVAAALKQIDQGA